MTSPPTLLPSPAAQPHGVVPRRFICYLRHIFNVNYFINPPLAPFACNNSLYVSLLCPVFCVLRPVVRLYTLCLTIVSTCPLISRTEPSCIAPSCRLCICCTFSVITISDILSQSNSESRSHVPCPALRVLCPASCFASDYALCSLCSYQHCPLSLAPRPCPSPPLCHLLHRATLLRYNFGLSCRMAIPSTAPRLFRRYSLEYNLSKVPSAVKPENPNCSLFSVNG